MKEIEKGAVVRLVHDLNEVPWKRGDLCIVGDLGGTSDEFSLTRMSDGGQHPNFVWTGHFVLDQFLTTCLKVKRENEKQESHTA